MPTKNKGKNVRNDGILKICERCGQPYNFTVKRKRGNRYYWYAVHIIKGEDGKKYRIEHYLGPVGKYIHSEVINKLNLKSAKEQNRFYEYLNKILEDHLANDHFDIEKAIYIIDKVMQLANEKVTEQSERQLISEKLAEFLTKFNQS